MKAGSASASSDAPQSHSTDHAGTQTNRPQADINITTSTQKRSISPLAGLLAFSAILVTACTLPPYLLRRRLSRVDTALNDVLHLTRRAEVSDGRNMLVAQARVVEMAREVRRVRDEIELLRGQVDRVAGDVRDVRSVVLKERVRLAAVEGRFDGLSEQIKTQESRILSALASEQKRYTKTENEINGLRKTAGQNADNLSKVALSLADIASFIDQTELEHGVPPEQGKESSKRVNALRDSALGVWQSIYNLHRASEKEK